MSTQYFDTLKTFVSKGKAASAEDMKGLVGETLAFVQGIKDKLQSSDPDVREKAMQEAKDAQKALESQVQGLCQEYGVDPEKLNEMAQNFSLEKIRLIAETQNQFDKIPKLTKT
jgi:hypothetical protein